VPIFECLVKFWLSISFATVTVKGDGHARLSLLVVEAVRFARVRVNVLA
jgi:hypothetical protein